MVNTNNLETGIVSVGTADYTLAPTLSVELEGRATGRNDFTIRSTQFSASLSFEATDAPRHLPTVTLRRGLSSISRNGQNDFELFIPIRHTVLERIEELREAGDLTLIIDFELKGEGKDEDSFRYHETHQHELSSPIWGEILNELGYHDRRGFELDLGTNEAYIQDILSTAYARVDRAQQRHDEGDYPSAIRLCRDALETLQHVEHNAEEAIGGDKWERLDSQISSLRKGFVGGLSHSEDMTGIETARRRDSDLILGLTKSYIRFLSTALNEDVDE